MDSSRVPGGEYSALGAVRIGAEASLEIGGADEVGVGVDMEAAVFPRKEVGDLVVAEEFSGVEGVEEAVAEGTLR